MGPSVPQADGGKDGIVLATKYTAEDVPARGRTGGERVGPGSYHQGPQVYAATVMRHFF
jgi:hypothetical protein